MTHPSSLLLIGLYTFALCIQPYRNDNNLCKSPLENGTCSACYTDPAALTIQSIYSKIAAADCALANPRDYPPQFDPTDEQEFDFIIVGAGSAGCVVANRLTEESGWSVLLLEAGGNPTMTSEVPALFPIQQKTEVDWQYQTDGRENNCLGMKENKCNWPRGKALGGSSIMNYMLYVRGNAKVYDGWEAQGNVGWGYKDVLPYFKKSEDMRAEEVQATAEFRQYHSTGGYLKVETFPNNEVKPLKDALAKGMREIGYHTNPDINGVNQTGFTTLQGMLQDGRRCSNAKAFLTSAALRKNLKISKHSLATEIITNSQKKAYGIKFIDDVGNIIKVLAKKEIILSAGAINTPQLLLLSGYGPQNHLEQLNIPIVQDLPVGRNLQDHVSMGGLIISVNFSKPNELPEKSMFDFLLTPDSRYSSIGLSSSAGFITTTNDVDYPDIQLLFIDLNKNDTGSLRGLLNLFGYREEIQNKFLEINQMYYTVLVFFSLIRPFSRGEILLNSRDPKEHPTIKAGYFSDQRDVDTLLRSYDVINKLVNTEGLQSIGAQLHELNIPQCSEFPFASKDYRVCSMRHLTTTTYHPACSCAMGPEGSKESVVDPFLQVKGVKGLRVVDASCMYKIPNGNTNAAVTMVAEKASDLIKETWSKGN